MPFGTFLSFFFLPDLIYPPLFFILKKKMYLGTRRCQSVAVAVLGGTVVYDQFFFLGGIVKSSNKREGFPFIYIFFFFFVKTSSRKVNEKRWRVYSSTKRVPVVFVHLPLPSKGA